MEEKAYAKINIGLSIGGREKDGLHSLESYMALIDLYDSLDISIEPSSSLSVSIHPDREYLAELHYLSDGVTYCPKQQLTMKLGEDVYSREAYGVIYAFPSTTWGWDGNVNIDITGDSDAYFLKLRSQKWKPAAPIFFDSLRIYNKITQQWCLGVDLRNSDMNSNQGHAHARHGNRINTAMLDGHVEALQMQKFAENYVKGISWKEMGITASAVIYSFNEQLALIPSTVK